MTLIRSPFFVSDMQSLSRRSPQMMGAIEEIEQNLASLERTMELPLFEEVVDILVQTGTLTWIERHEYLLRSTTGGLRARIAILADVGVIFAIAIEPSVAAAERE